MVLLFIIKKKFTYRGREFIWLTFLECPSKVITQCNMLCKCHVGIYLSLMLINTYPWQRGKRFHILESMQLNS